jgi:hypothetical protein
MLLKHEYQRHCLKAIYFVMTIMSGASFGGLGMSMKGDKNNVYKILIW